MVLDKLIFDALERNRGTREEDAREPGAYLIVYDPSSRTESFFARHPVLLGYVQHVRNFFLNISELLEALKIITVFIFALIYIGILKFVEQYSDS